MNTSAATVKRIWRVLAEVMDPEIPVISVVDLGVVRDVKTIEGKAIITITPTYSGCPATDVIAADICSAMRKNSIRVTLKTILAPPWTTDWISENGKQKLKQFGIAPPSVHTVECPLCASENVELVSEFGSTPCKSHYKCSICLEPFDRFKCI
ncbi:MAG: 1,2-phenylacetyl-CoA epoxidase subunit PaaD [Arenicellales bacterium WSBS_2016_MAG_OTU3]